MCEPCETPAAHNKNIERAKKTKPLLNFNYRAPRKNQRHIHGVRPKAPKFFSLKPNGFNFRHLLGFPNSQAPETAPEIDEFVPEGLGFRFDFIPRPVEIGRSRFFCVCGSGDLGGVVDGRWGSGQEGGAGEGSACAVAAVR